MTFIVDARKLPCPQPVVLTIKAMEEADDITTIVSSKIAKENVTRLAKDRGFTLEITMEGEAFRLHMVRSSPRQKLDHSKSDTTPPHGKFQAERSRFAGGGTEQKATAASSSISCAPCAAVNGECVPESVEQGHRVLLLTSETIGQGDDALGRKLMTSFVQILGEIPEKPNTVIFMNSAAKLVVRGAPALEDLRDLEEKGVELLVCGTCLGHYELTDSVAVGKVSNMYDIASALFAASKIVSP